MRELSSLAIAPTQFPNSDHAPMQRAALPRPQSHNRTPFEDSGTCHPSHPVQHSSWACQPDPRQGSRRLRPPRHNHLRRRGSAASPPRGAGRGGRVDPSSSDVRCRAGGRRQAKACCGSDWQTRFLLPNARTFGRRSRSGSSKPEHFQHGLFAIHGPSRGILQILFVGAGRIGGPICFPASTTLRHEFSGRTP